MTTSSPSYLVKSRHGIYYFQIRIPSHTQINNSLKSKLLRRSLKTRNKAKAIKIARKWALLMQSEWEEEADELNTLLAKGIILLDQLNAIDPDNVKLIEDFLFHLSPLQTSALKFADVVKSRSAQREKTLEADNHSKQDAILDKRIQKNLSNLTPNTPQLNNLHLSDIVQEFLNTQTAQNWAPSSLKKIHPQLKTLVALLEDPIDIEITKQLLRDKYSKNITEIPKFKDRKEYKNGKKQKPLLEIISQCKKSKDNRRSSATISDEVKNIITFLKWAGKNDYLVKDLHYALEDFITSSKKAPKKRKLFTNDDIKKLFETPEYQQGLLLKNPHLHWSPLLALLTGARENEICGLQLTDITYHNEAKTWVIDFAPHERKLKTQYSTRATPIHEMLVNLGFINYVNQLKTNNEQQVFPALKPNKTGSYIRNVSRWFNGYKRKDKDGVSYKVQGYKEKCGVFKTETETETKNFHSFRHTFINKGKQSLQDGAVIREIVGHVPERKDVHAETYEEDYEMHRRKEAMNQINFDLDFESIKKWPK